MFGTTRLDPPTDAQQWSIDLENKRKYNPLYFDANLAYQYDKSTLPSGLRPDLTDYSQNAFHKKLRLAMAFRVHLMNQVFNEQMRYKLFGTHHNFDTLKVDDRE